MLRQSWVRTLLLNFSALTAAGALATVVSDEPIAVVLGRFLPLAGGILLGTGVPLLLLWASLGTQQRDEKHAAEFAGEFRLVRTASPDPEELRSSVAALERLLDRTNTSIDRVERMASVVPAALGVIATLSVGRIAHDIHAPLSWFGVAAASAGVLALMASISCIVHFRPDVPGTYQALYTLTNSLPQFQQAYIEELVRSIERGRLALRVKAGTLGESLYATVVAVALLYFFAIAGGFAPPGT